MKAEQEGGGAKQNKAKKMSKSTQNQRVSRQLVLVVTENPK